MYITLNSLPYKLSSHFLIRFKKYHIMLFSEVEYSNAGTEGDISHENFGTCYQ